MLNSRYHDNVAYASVSAFPTSEVVAKVEMHMLAYRESSNREINECLFAFRKKTSKLIKSKSKYKGQAIVAIK